VKLLFATHNRGKLAELRALVEPHGFEVLSADDVPLAPVEEDAATFAGNAEKKARAAHAQTGLAALADDSGLEVDALDGAPGVYSARYAGAAHDDAANNAKLLAALADVPDGKRGARFRCALAFVDRAHAPALLTDGVCEGAIARAPRGTHGFGYDPLFLVADAGYARTMAELAPDEKNRLSHRARALGAMTSALATRRAG
jgi:XTP/dITP diphosphohydrolase